MITRYTLHISLRELPKKPNNEYRESIKEKLDAIGLLQVNATIIAGILLLFSVSTFFTPIQISSIPLTGNRTVDAEIEEWNMAQEDLSRARDSYVKSIFTIAMLTPFVISSYLIVYGSKDWALFALKVGFFALLAALFLWLLINYELFALSETRELREFGQVLKLLNDPSIANQTKSN